MTEHTHFDFAKLSERERYKILIGTVIPRPIALVTTVSKDGTPNAGPFSFTTLQVGPARESFSEKSLASSFAVMLSTRPTFISTNSSWMPSAAWVDALIPAPAISSISRR
ncbi:hypothetical protein DSM25558_2483 [Agrobacterium sp. DSM 25558]|nr:hypothetical protein DSM25558_2483 [Agrobacterium sp. DSM 25558]